MFPAIIQIAGRILKPQRKGFRQMSTGICPAIDHIHCCSAYSLSAQISLQHSLHLVDPWHLHRGTVMQDYNRIRLYCRYCRDQFILALRHTHMLTVIPL